MASTPPTYSEVPPHQGKWGAAQWTNILRLALWLWRNVRSMDVVHIHHAVSWQMFVAATICLTMGVPYVVSPHGALYPWSLSRRAIRSWMFLRFVGLYLLRQSAAVIATSEIEARVVRQLDRRVRVKVIPPGILGPAGRRSDDGRRNNSGVRLTVAFVGRLEPQKGLPTLLEAISRLRRQQVDVKLSIIGSGEVSFMRRLKETAKELDVEEVVEFHGTLIGDAKQEVLRAADVFALPSNMENFSFATAEAISMGLPVVISSEVALAEMVRRYDCGVVVPVGDAEALSIGLAKFLDEQQVSAYVQRSLACAAAEFSLGLMGRSHEALYREVAVVCAQSPVE